QTAPYLHDGRAATLQDVFKITGDRMGIVSNLSSAELDQLVQYLLQLDDVPETVVPEPDPTPQPTPMLGGMSRGSASSAACTVSHVGGSGSTAQLAAFWIFVCAVLGRRRH